MDFDDSSFDPGLERTVVNLITKCGFTVEEVMSITGLSMYELDAVLNKAIEKSSLPTCAYIQ